MPLIQTQATTNLTNTASLTEGGAHILARPGGGYTLVWNGQLTPSSVPEVFKTSYDAAGVQVGATINLSDSTDVADSTPIIVALAGGGSIVSWSTEFEGVSGNTAKLFDANGAFVADISSTGPTRTFTPAVGGGFAETWIETNATGATAWILIHDASGAATGVPILLGTVVFGGGDGLSQIQATALTGGGYAVQIQVNNGIFESTTTRITIHDANGYAVAGAPTLEFSIGFVGSTGTVLDNITALQGGGFAVSWTTDTNGHFVRVYDASANAVSAALDVSDVSASDVMVKALADGGFVAISAADTNLVVKVFGADGQALSAATVVTTSPYQLFAKVSELANGFFALVWQEQASGDIFTAVYGSDGQIAPGTSIVNVSNSAGVSDSGFDIAARDGGLGYVITWQGQSGTQSDVYSAAFGLSGYTFGTAGADPLNGTLGTDYIYGLAGDDTIDGKGGADFILGGSGTDRIVYDAGAAQLDGGDGTDTLVINLTAANGPRPTSFNLAANHFEEAQTIFSDIVVNGVIGRTTYKFYNANWDLNYTLVDRIDNTNTQNYSHYTETFNAAGQKLNTNIFYDTGLLAGGQSYYSYDLDAATPLTYTVTYTDGTAPNGALIGGYNWYQQTIAYHGSAIAMQDITYDTGLRTVLTYTTPGVTTDYVDERYNVIGEKTSKTARHTDGSREVTSYDIQSDGNANWIEQTSFYNTAGVRTTAQIAYDNGGSSFYVYGDDATTAGADPFGFRTVQDEKWVSKFYLNGIGSTLTDERHRFNDDTQFHYIFDYLDTDPLHNGTVEYLAANGTTVLGTAFF